MVNAEEAVALVLNRLRRAQRQLADVVAMIGAGRDCNDVVTQPAAVSKALVRAGSRSSPPECGKCLPGDASEGMEAMTEAEPEKLLLALA